jgi:hypothetical protein
MIEANWIENILAKSKENTRKESFANNNPLELDLINCIITNCYNYKNSHPDISLGRILASGFDILISADYYSFIGHKDWFYCPSTPPLLFYHFTNCCPRHCLNNEFYFHQSSKPESGIIGKSTSRLLRYYYSSLLRKKNRNEVLLKGTEPVDLIMVDEENKKILFAEIKASPLVTLPLVIETEQLASNNMQIIEHSGSLVLNSIYDRQIKLFLPILENNLITPSYIDFGVKHNLEDTNWSYRSMLALLTNDNNFFSNYFHFWDVALKKYYPKETDSIYWLTNSCGAPTPKPLDWPKAKSGGGQGFESISDSKTSVGMDRTDDIKKGIYQVLKLGSEGKPISSIWDFKVGIISNINAERHFEEYLRSLQNLIWTNDNSGRAKKAGDLSSDHPLYNLFDGIIALTESHFRDEWIEEVFSFEINE